jgi:LysR family transcriptional activator of nhaA
VEWLNYHHLLYFWAVARHGGLASAAAELKVTPQTISAQLRSLEASLGEALFDRSGRSLVLTERGHLVLRYADEIFALGRELVGTVRGRPTGRALRLRVGVANVLPKLVTHLLLEPAFALDRRVRVICHEDKAERLMADLAIHAYDVVLSDIPIPPTVSVKAFNHLLGSSPVTFLAAPTLAGQLRDGFPGSLNEAPMLMPTDDTSVRRSLEQWLDRQHVRPKIVGEFEDSALLKAFAQAGRGVFCAPSIVEAEICRQYEVQAVARVDEIVERFYAITVERRVAHPAVSAICDAARASLSGL